MPIVYRYCHCCGSQLTPPPAHNTGAKAELKALRGRIRDLRDCYLGGDGSYPDRHTVRVDLDALLETD